MNPFEMVVAIIVIVTIGKIVQAKIRTQASEAPLRAADSEEARHMQAEIRSLRERIAVLERVITDNHSSVSLEREIERLRDEGHR
ncbi:hypothetical protein [Stakelama pacifica]|uniref:Phage shock protein B n=1 Tax=Stakelama pacifica TaxID=517720 RepID=A0A4R6FGM5_9SPHN|nr:hypothetical protein [Stakelama pacifica]TDN79910.1 hypothetical protein EV664_11167 [Stakelama pacifica]GGO98185.1 hypothetical protein GCM10011329_28750 [Stakelama pacifica]